LWILVGVLALIGLLALTRPSGAESQDLPQSATPTTSTSTAPVSPPPQSGTSTPESGADVASPQSSDPGWRAVVEGFAADFANDGDHNVWLKRLTRWVTPELADGFTETSDTRRPTGKVVDIAPESEGDYAAEALVHYDSGLQVHLRVEYGTDGWRVASVTPVPPDNH
jgi:hypothetical protein